jgi:thiol-disulfide isomerase/thioredoxin
MSTKALLGILLAGAAGILIFLFVHLSRGNGVEVGTSTASAGCKKGEADCLPIVNYVDTTGQAYTPQSLTGKVVVVNFWATWCHPCEAEIPDLSKVYEAYKAKDVVFLGVLTNDDNKTDQQLLNFASDHEMTYPIVRGNSDILSSYNYPSGLPTTVVFGKGGKRVFARVGGVHEDEMTRLLDKLVAEK